AGADTVTEHCHVRCRQEAAAGRCRTGTAVDRTHAGTARYRAAATDRDPCGARAGIAPPVRLGPVAGPSAGTIMTSATPHPSASRLAGDGLPADVLHSIDDEAVPTRSLPTGRTSVSGLRAAGWHRDDLWLPAVVLHEPIVQHNLERFHRWCVAAGVELAPHGKTTMSPHLWSAQLDRNVWGLSAATVAQARVMRDCGVSRVLIANEVIDPG